MVKKSNVKFNYRLQVLDQQPELQLLMANKSILVDNSALIMYMSDEVYLFASYIGRKLQRISEETQTNQKGKDAETEAINKEKKQIRTFVSLIEDKYTKDSLILAIVKTHGLSDIFI